MPRNHCCGFENLQRVQHLGSKAIETYEHKPIDAFEDKPLRRS
jgi:hypothetical protein